MKIKIKEKSLLAKLARKKLKSSNVALVLGNTIYLSGASRQELLNNKSWLRHELKHVEQCLRYGMVLFVMIYLWESILKGYTNNRLEIEARAAEDKDNFLEKYIY